MSIKGDVLGIENRNNVMFKSGTYKFLEKLSINN